MSSSGIRLGAVDTELPTAAALADGAANPTAPMVGAASLLLGQPGTWNRQRDAGGIADAAAFGFPVTGLSVFNGTSWDRQRTPTVFKTAAATAAGLTSVWTPAAGKKFRLLAFALLVTGNAAMAVAGTEAIQLQDSGTLFGLAFDLYAPAASVNQLGDAFYTGWVAVGNGYLSAAANNVLQVWLASALTTGYVRVNVAGTEE